MLINDMKTDYIWKNWVFLKWEEALEHNFTHSLHYGSWVFEGIRFYDTHLGPKIFRLKEHIERLYYSARVLDLNIEYTQEEVMEICLELIKKNKIKSWYIRPIVYFGCGTLSPNPVGSPTEFAISMLELWSYLWEDPVDVKIASVMRTDPRTMDMNAKIVGNYVNSILASLEVTKQWYKGGLLLDTQWNIAEWPWYNIFFVKKGNVYTPGLWSILPGITRNSIIELFKDKSNIQVFETQILTEDLSEMDEAFFTWTAAEVSPISSITDLDWNVFKYTSSELDSITMKIKKIYKEVVMANDEDYLHRLS